MCYILLFNSEGGGGDYPMKSWDIHLKDGVTNANIYQVFWRISSAYTWEVQNRLYGQDR